MDYKFEHDQMIKSLLHFHPESNLEILNKEEMAKIPFNGFTYPVIELPLLKKYSTVTHIDADVIVVDRIDELFDDTSDVRAGRNNSDNNRAATGPGFTLDDISWDKYVNAGIHSVSSEQFMQDWYNVCATQTLPFGEQGALNKLFNSGKYNAKLLDPIESSVYYGSSFIEGTRTYWDVWKNIVVKDDHLELNNKRIKMIHWAGNCAKPPISTLVTPEVNDFIRNILDG